MTDATIKIFNNLVIVFKRAHTDMEMPFELRRYGVPKNNLTLFQRHVPD